MKKVFIETYGCQMNVHDSEKALSSLANAGYEYTSALSEADLVLLNTCMVREKPQQKVFKRIEAIKSENKRQSKDLPILGIMGCVAQAEAERIFERNKDIRLVMGTQSVSKLPELLQQLEQGYPRAIDTTQTRDAEFFDINPDYRTSKQIAYVSIIEGCNKFCSYCIVPFTRGRERSRPADNILKELQELALRNIKEVHLLGQNVNSYGLSGRFRGNVPTKINHRAEDELTFAELLERLALKSGIQRIKYTTSYPRDFDQEIVRVMDDHAALCEWVHLPAQSGSDSILKKMRRGYSFSEYMRKIEMVRGGKKDYSLTGDIIVGFPGETEDDFLATVRLVEEVQYDGLYIFQYSPRPKTAAIAYDDSVPEALKTERLMRLVEIQNRIQHKRYERYLGRVVEVLVEGQSVKSETEFAGHSRCQKTVNFPKGGSKVGDLVQVKIDRVGKNSLHGQIFEPEL